MDDFIYANPEAFYLYALIPVLIAWYIFRLNKKHPSLKMPNMRAFEGIRPGWKQRFRHLGFILRLVALSLVIFALARPQTSSSRKSEVTEGIDIVLTIDVSTSMLAEDLKPNRLQSAKLNAMDFVDARINDRIGIVVFAAESYTQCPVTIDHTVLKQLFTDIKTGIIQDGTAIGAGLATAINRLKDSKSESKVIVLLTDGDNNAGNIAPETAADIAKTFGIRVYTIGVGSKGKAPYPVKTPFGTQYQYIQANINEELLQQIAETTGGEYFRATDNKSLEEIYKNIDRLEKTKIDVSYFSKKTEGFLPFVLAALGVFFLELLLRYTVFRTIP